MSLRPLKLLFPYNGILQPFLPPLPWQEGKYIDSQEFYRFCQCDGAQQLPLTRLVVDLIFRPLTCHLPCSSSFSFHDFTGSSLKSHMEGRINTELMINQFQRKTGGNIHVAIIEILLLPQWVSLKQRNKGSSLIKRRSYSRGFEAHFVKCKELW